MQATAEMAVPRRRATPRLTWPQKIFGYGGITLAAVAMLALLRIDWTLPLYRRYVASPMIVSAYFKTAAVPKLQIGSGPNNLPGWLNTEIEPEAGQAFLDATKPFPIPDGSVRFVFAEQLIEHLTWEEGQVMLRESHRVMVPGGKIRIATPHLANLVAAFDGQHPDYIARQVNLYATPMDIDPGAITLNRMMHDYGHKMLYTPRLLRAALERAGFRDVKEFLPEASDTPELTKIDIRKLAPDNTVDTLTMQATR